jgi:hypothetical protein
MLIKKLNLFRSKLRIKNLFLSIKNVWKIPNVPKKIFASDSLPKKECLFQILSGFNSEHELLSMSQLALHSSEIVVLILLNVLRLA